MTIIAIDAAAKTGWAHRTAGGWATGRLDPTKTAALASMLRAAKADGVDAVVVEDCYLGINVQTVIRLARIHGRIQAVCDALGLPVRFVHPQSWKAAMLPKVKGRAEQKQAAMALAWRKGAPVKNNDEADAVCLCAYAETHGPKPVTKKIRMVYRAKSKKTAVGSED